MKNIIWLFSILFGLKLQAQVINQSTDFNILSGSIVSIVSPSFTNQGNMSNEGELLVAGDWVNEGDYNSLEGSMQMNGDQLQTLDHNAQSFHNLILSGGGIKLIQKNFTVNHTLTLSEGKIKAENGAQLIMAPGSELLGGNDQSYIIGELVQSGSVDLHFPIGTENDYLPVQIKGITDMLEPIGIVVLNGSPNQSSAAFAAIDDRHFWLVNTNNSSASSVQFRYMDNITLGDIDMLTLAFSPDEVRSFESLGQLVQDGDLFGMASSIKSGYYAFASLNPDIPSIRVVNVVTAMQDGKHDFLRIENIEYHENNRVEIYNRAGVLVFSMNNYNNRDRVFRGVGNVGFSGDLTTGNYVYTVKMSDNVESGFLFLKQ